MGLGQVVGGILSYASAFLRVFSVQQVNRRNMERYRDRYRILVEIAFAHIPLTSACHVATLTAMEAQECSVAALE